MSGHLQTGVCVFGSHVCWHVCTVSGIQKQKTKNLVVGSFRKGRRPHSPSGYLTTSRSSNAGSRVWEKWPITHWSMFIPGALHGIGASLLAKSSLLWLRSFILRVIGSRRQPLANVGAVLSLLDGPQGCDPACMIRRYLSFRPSEVGRVCLLLDMVREGCPGHRSTPSCCWCRWNWVPTGSALALLDCHGLPA